MKLSIPTPCTVPHSEMEPTAGGLHCQICAHTVMDFRDWTTEEIQAYFNHKTGKTCGIFYQDQLSLEPIDIPMPTFNGAKLSFSQQFLYALFICFGTWLFSCNTPTAQKSVEIPTHHIAVDKIDARSKESTTAQKPEKEDADRLKIMGDIMYIPDTNATELAVDSISMSDNVWRKPEIPATFPTGMEGLDIYLKKNLTYPTFEKQNKIEGTVYCDFIVDKYGNVKEPRIIRSVSDNFDAEVIRIIKKMPRWKAAKQDGKRVHSFIMLPIVFKLGEI